MEPVGNDAVLRVDKRYGYEHGKKRHVKRRERREPVNERRGKKAYPTQQFHQRIARRYARRAEPAFAAQKDITYKWYHIVGFERI
ncbi:hypothetical protein SDC9_194168 [bioreactor metagenome]|uniref:Uncharacterized protein n=1 Tax=bioreactor metagenome TaxID=1076179 RepID=A0A645I5I7_9ZZZZ